MEFGIDRLLADAALRKPLTGRRVALLAHPASVTRDVVHSLDALAALGDVRLTAAFGPQHGLRGDKQDNMIESDDFTDPVHGIPVFSLYGDAAPPDGGDDGPLRRAARRPAGRRHAHLHVRHHAALRARGGGAARQGGVGPRPPQSGRTADRRPAAARRAGRASSAPARSRCATGSRSASWRAGSSTRCASTSSARSSRCGAGNRRARPDAAGRSASAPG